MLLEQREPVLVPFLRATSHWVHTSDDGIVMMPQRQNEDRMKINSFGIILQIADPMPVLRPAGEAMPC